MSSAFEDVALPRLPDGRTYISDEMIAQDPALPEFVRRGHNFWSYDHLQQHYVSPHQEDDR